VGTQLQTSSVLQRESLSPELRPARPNLQSLFSRELTPQVGQDRQVDLYPGKSLAPLRWGLPARTPAAWRSLDSGGRAHIRPTRRYWEQGPERGGIEASVRFRSPPPLFLIDHSRRCFSVPVAMVGNRPTPLLGTSQKCSESGDISEAEDSPFPGRLRSSVTAPMPHLRNPIYQFAMHRLPNVKASDHLMQRVPAEMSVRIPRRLSVRKVLARLTGISSQLRTF
jgi:hypothetical protein